MGPGILWNLTEYVRRIGGKRSDQPPVAFGVQPVLIVGDSSAIASPLLPPVAWFGGVFTSNGSAAATVEIASKAAGGCFVRTLASASITGAHAFYFGIRDTATSLAGDVTYSGQNMGPSDVSSVVRSGSGAPFADTAIVPSASSPSALSQVSIDDTYLPPGKHFAVTTGVNAARTVNFCVMIQDVPVVVPSD